MAHAGFIAYPPISIVRLRITILRKWRGEKMTEALDLMVEICGLPPIRNKAADGWGLRYSAI